MTTDVVSEAMSGTLGGGSLGGVNTVDSDGRSIEGDQVQALGLDGGSTLGIDVMSKNSMAGEQSAVGEQGQMGVETKVVVGEKKVVEGEEEGVEEEERVVLSRWSLSQVSASLRELTEASEACRRVDNMLKAKGTAKATAKPKVVAVVAEGVGGNATTFADFLKQTDSINNNDNANDGSTTTTITTSNNNDNEDNSQLDTAVNALLYGDLELVRRGVEVGTIQTHSPSQSQPHPPTHHLKPM